uniref:Uncharacterized protein n=1 Tax=Arcella intermedia TaxID=1963864 RepID=A0A6B2LKY0_9EUKA
MVQGIQACTGEKRGFEWTRCAKMCIYGAVLSGPLNHYWYRLLDQRITAGRSLGWLGHSMDYKKLLLDQVVFAPFIVGAFLASMAVLDGKYKNIKEKLESDFLPTLKLNYYLWPAAQFINFRFVPSHHRVGYVSLVIVGWSCLLSWSTSQSKIKHAKEL